jgi:cobalamin biosynthesis Mg chelatase CobN
VIRTCPLSRRLCLLAVLALTALGSLLVSAGPALAASCGKQVVDDWYDNGRVDKIYPLSCYREAIRILPTDVLDYSNAKQEIGRALAYAKQGKEDPGSKPTTGTTATTETSTTSTETSSTQTTPDGTQTTETTPETNTTGTDTTSLTEAGGNVDTSGPSSVPVPLIVLGGLAVLLLAAGSAGYLARRSSGRKGGDGPPPASA